MLIRQTAPVLGAANPYTTPGEWEVGVAFRGLNSDDHYNGTAEQVQRHTLGTFVINRQRAADFTISYTVTPRLSLSTGIPIVVASWSIPSPTRPVPGPRAQQDAQGLGDISVTGRYWLFNPSAHPRRNVAAAFGVKMPTGPYDVQDRIPDANGVNVAMRTVDQSIQPGDGGWGLIFQGQGFTQVKRAVLFASGTYLANPRNTNGVPSLIVSRGAAANPANHDKLVNSVPDQYVVRVGASMKVWRAVAGSLAWRQEGLPRYDLIGRSNGFRRPGRAMFVEPGVSYGRGRHSVTFNVPIGFYYNRMPDPNTDLAGDATFPRHIFLGTYSYRFGGRKAPAATPRPR